MSKRRIAAFCIAAILVAGALTSLMGAFRHAVPSDPTPESKTSAAGALRIVSLSPSVTEMLFVLGLGKSIVGVTDHCDYPPEAKRIERVGGLGKPSLEKLLALSPDLIVGTGAERNDAIRAVRESGARVLKVKIDSIDDVFEALRKIGDAVRRRRRADEAIASMQAELRRIGQQSGGRERARPRVFVELWDDPLATVGGNSFLDDVISRAGGVNVAHECAQPHLHVSAEKVIEWNPDVVVVVHMKRSVSDARQIAGRIGWSEISAVKHGRVFCDIPADLLLRPGPRLIEGVKVLADRLRKDAAEGRPPMSKVE